MLSPSHLPIFPNKCTEKNSWATGIATVLNNHLPITYIIVIYVVTPQLEYLFSFVPGSGSFHNVTNLTKVLVHYNWNYKNICNQCVYTFKHWVLRLWKFINPINGCSLQKIIAVLVVVCNGFYQNGAIVFRWCCMLMLALCVSRSSDKA